MLTTKSLTDDINSNINAITETVTDAQDEFCLKNKKEKKNKKPREESENVTEKEIGKKREPTFNNFRKNYFTKTETRIRHVIFQLLTPQSHPAKILI